MKNISKLLGTFLPLAVPISLTISCTKNEKPNKSTPKEPQQKYNRDFVSGNAWYTGSAEMQAMALTEYNQAKTMFNVLKKQTLFDDSLVNGTTGVIQNTPNNKSVPVVWMDLDETVLNNVSYDNYNVINNKGFSPDSWTKWVKAAKARAIPGAISFINYVWTHGGVVIFNSNREQFVHKDKTRENLINLGLNQKFLPDWAFWMQGIDETASKPWNVQKKDNKGKEEHTHKEARVNALNSKASWDLSNMTQGQVSSGDAVSLKTIMRIGDNLNDFNDNATKHKLNKERRAIVTNHIGKNFGCTLTFGQIYDESNKSWTNETWNEGYVLIGGNSAYGGWEEGLADNYFHLTAEQKAQKRLEGLKAFPAWDGTSTWNGS